MDALIAIANSAGTLPGRKNLLWISGSFPFSVGYEDLSNLAQIMNDPKREVNLSGEQQMYAEDIERAARALNDANIAVYPVDARGLIGPSMNTAKGNSKTPGFGAMNSGSQGTGLAGSGGGRGGGRGSGEGRFPSNRPLREPGGNSATGSSANLIAIRTTPPSRPWTRSRKEPEVAVRSRKGYFALPPTPPSPDAVRAVVASAVASPLDATALNLAVRMKTGEQDVGILSAMLFFDPRSIQMQPRDGGFAGTIDIVLAQLGERQEVLHADQQSLPLRFDAPQYEQFQKQQVALTQPVTLLPNARSLRVVLREATTGKVGSVTIPLAKYPPQPPGKAAAPTNH